MNIYYSSNLINFYFKIKIFLNKNIILNEVKNKFNLKYLTFKINLNKFIKLLIFKNFKF